MTNNFLIDNWFPFVETSVESIRERGSSNALPPINALHVWFARRPLTASRISILCSLLQHKDREKIFKIMGMPHDKDILGAMKKIDVAKSTGRRIETPFTW